ncbi:MAG TPA: hypothetical protein VFR85_20130 [Anaeromyxobacteraceae bacterium]|nr:hypothetical protein [Anaeromyxobacteraceae bacterium]
MPPAPKGTRRVTANLPVDLLSRAQRATGKGITETLVAGLEALDRRRAAEKLIGLAGKVKIDLDLDLARERPRH